jgi:hypothetical protein
MERRGAHSVKRVLKFDSSPVKAPKAGQDVSVEADEQAIITLFYQITPELVAEVERGKNLIVTVSLTSKNSWKTLLL